MSEWENEEEVIHSSQSRFKVASIKKENIDEEEFFYKIKLEEYKDE